MNSLIYCLNKICMYYGFYEQEYNELISSELPDDFNNSNLRFVKVDITNTNSSNYPLLIESDDGYNCVLPGERVVVDKIKCIWQCFPAGEKLNENYWFFIWRIIGKYRNRSPVVILLSIASSASSLFLAWFVSVMFENYATININNLTLFLLGFILFMLLFVFIKLKNLILLKSLDFSVLIAEFSEAIEEMLHLSISEINQSTAGEISQFISQHEQSLSLFFSNIFKLICNILSIIALMIFLMVINRSVGFSLLFFIMVSSTVKVLLIKRYMKIETFKLTEKGNVALFLNEIFLQIQHIKSHNSERNILDLLLSKFIKIGCYTKRSITLEFKIEMVDLIMATIIVIEIYLIYYFNSTQISDSSIFTFLIIASLLVGLLSEVSSLLLVMMPCKAAYDKLVSYIPLTRDNKLVTKKINTEVSSIVFQEVCLSKAGKDILKNISFSIQPGSFVGIIGSSGAGKSTLLKLLLGLESLTSGSILINKMDINALDITAFRKQFGVVLQNSSLFEGTIYSNIAVDNNVSQSKIWELIDFVGLYDDVMSMPMKIHTFLSDNAEESISGGQKQKILIARALANNPTVLLMDEATSSLDNLSQEYINYNLQKLNLTRIVVAHRYTTIAHADIVHYIDDGRLIKSGTFPELKLSLGFT